MMRRLLPLLAAALLALQLAGCSSSDDADNGAVTVDVPAANTEATSTASPAAIPSVGSSPSAAAGDPTHEVAAQSEPPAPSAVSQDQALTTAAKDVVGALRDRDLKRLASWISPDRGVRFSPYAHLDAERDLTFKAEELPTFKDKAPLTWGAYDGSGEAIKLTFRDYFEKFVYDQDFADAPSVSTNKLVGKGNTPFNGTEVYPDASYVEFHFPGFDNKLEGHDWESLILSFVPSGSDWKLCAVTHAQWTI